MTTPIDVIVTPPPSVNVPVSAPPVITVQVSTSGTPMVIPGAPTGTTVLLVEQVQQVTVLEQAPTQVTVLGGAQGDPGAPGAAGLSAYQIAVNNGFVGSQAQWLASLQGQPGTPGTPGAPGSDAQRGIYAGTTAPVGAVPPYLWFKDMGDGTYDMILVT